MVVALLAACGGGQHGTTGGGGSGTAGLGSATTKSYAPLGIKDDAKTPSQAVILGTDDKNGSTVLPLPDAQSKAMVDAMCVKMGGERAADRRLHAGQADDRAEHRRHACRSASTRRSPAAPARSGAPACGSSAFVAATTLGKDLTDFTFSASSGRLHRRRVGVGPDGRRLPRGDDRRARSIRP